MPVLRMPFDSSLPLLTQGIRLAPLVQVVEHHERGFAAAKPSRMVLGRGLEPPRAMPTCS